MILLTQYTLIFASILILVALGGCVSEHSGVINLGLEGIMVIGALASTMDNCLVSGSTMMGHDLTDKGDPIRRGRIGGFAVAAIGLSIALIPGLTLIHLWLIYATMRAATLAPTILTFIRKDWQPAANGMFWGIIIALAVAMPLFIYGSFVPGADLWKTVGSLLTIIVSTTFCLILKDREETTA